MRRTPATAQVDEVAEKRVRESEERYRALVTASTQAVWVTNARGEAVSADRGWQELTGQTDEDMRRFGWLQAIHPDDRERTLALWQRAVETKTPYESEFRVRRRDGSYRQFHSRAVPILEEDGTVREWIGANTDITEQRRVEQALRESEARFRTLADTALVMVWQSGTDTLCDFFNEGWLAFTGRTLEQELGNGWVEGVHPDDRERCVATYLSCFDARSPFTMEYRLRRADGEYRCVLDNGTPRYIPSGEFVGYIGACLDITEFKQTEQALRNSEARNQDLLRVLPDLIFLQDKNGVYLDFHAKDLSQLLVPPEQFLGKNMREVLPPHLSERIVNCFHEAAQSDEPSVLEYALQLGQETRHFEARIIRCQQDSFLSIVRDITERKLAEQSLQQAQAELALVARRLTLGELAASIAHEINQPLTAIVTNAEAGARLLARGQFEDLKSTLGDIREDGNHAASVIRQTRALFTEHAPYIESLDLNQLILDVATITRQEILRLGVLLSTEVADDLPAAQGDRILLQQVMLNLIMNGLDAMGGVQDRPRELVIRSRKTESGAVLVSVTDSGVGFDPQDATRLFDAFFTTKPSGMGVGLSISRSIITAHGGELWASSNEPYGSTFHLLLPANGDGDLERGPK